MERGLLEHARGERLIATGRVLLALFAMGVVYLDPDIAGTQVRLLPLAVAFALYALVLTLLGWRAPILSVRARVAVHVIDFLLFSFFIELTHASVSPFFIFFLFSLLSALVRFGVRGMVITAGAAIVTYVALALSDEKIRSDPGYLIMRATSLSVATLLLAYVGAFHERVRAELAKLAAWPAVTSDQIETAVGETLVLACDLLAVPRAALLWEEEEEPWVTIAVLEEGQHRFTRQPPDYLDSLLNPSARRATFLVRGDGEDLTLLAVEGQARRTSESPLTEAGRALFRASSVLSAPVLGQTVKGRIFFFDRLDFQIDDIAVVEIVTRLVASRLDNVTVAARVRAAAVAEERLRVARDLHDGFLQSLTGVSLQLEMTDRLLATDPEAARERVRSVQSLITADQRELRALISDLRPDAPRSQPRLPARLGELAERFRQQWDIEMEVLVDPVDPPVQDRLASEIYNLVSEGAFNAAKHAGATRIGVELYVREREVEMIVADDGRGFPFTGVYTLAELTLNKRGPRTLKERVAALGGDMLLRSTPGGSRVEIRIARA